MAVEEDVAVYILAEAGVVVWSAVATVTLAQWIRAVTEPFAAAGAGARRATEACKGAVRVGAVV